MKNTKNELFNKNKKNLKKEEIEILLV